MNKELLRLQQDTAKNQIHPDLFGFYDNFAELMAENEPHILIFSHKSVSYTPRSA
ncbi:MAG: hypothetical protein MUP16_03330 [Sedimentisphaerales bacterium]|nr:hypothetical protein [Sedimentisphaerales bacterium]